MEKEKFNMKIKTSILMKDLIKNSQISMQEEDNNLIQSITKYINEKSVYNIENMLEIINLNNEFVRMVFVKTIIKTLIEYDILDNDIDICDINTTNNIVINAVNEACKNK